MESFLGFHPPHLSEDAAWLPPWLLHPSTNPSPPPSAQSPIHRDVGRLQRSISSRENGNLSDNGKCKSFQLFLSGEDNTPMTFPSGSSNNEAQYRLHLSSNGESQYSLNTILSNSQSERSAFRQAPQLQHPETKAIPEKDTTEVNHNVDEAFIAPIQQRVNLEISSHKSLKSKEQKGKNSKVTAKSRKAGMNDAVELSVAASEALTIHEVVKDEPSMKLSFASAVLEAAIRVKQARLEDFEETYSSSIEESNEVDFDFLSDLDELSMADAYEDVGLTVTDQGDLSGYESMSHVRDTYASESYVSSSKQKCTEPGGLEVGSGSGSGSASPERHRLATGRTNARPESVRLDRENADLACDFDAVFDCSVEQANFNTTEVVLEREDFTIEDPQSSKTILRSSLQSGTFECNGRKDMTNLVQDRFQSRWFGGWTWKSKENIPADVDDKCRKNMPELFANETSSFSESADIAPDMNSCIQRQDNECKTVSQSSMAPEHTNERCSNNENFHSDDVAVTPSESPMDLLCSVVPCSFASDNVVSQDCNHQTNLENNPIAEPNFDNLKRAPTQNTDLLTDEGRFISKVNGGRPPTISRHAASLKTFSMLPGSDPYLDKEQIHGESLPSEHNQTSIGDTELAVQMEKEINIPTTINSENITRCPAPTVSGEENIEQNVVSESNVELLEPTTRLFRKVECNFKNYLVPRRKRVRFSECEINFPQVKKFKKAPQIKLKDPLVARRICRGLRNSKPRAKSKPHEVEKHSPTDKNKVFHDLKFLLTGFSVKKHKEITNLIHNNGGIVLDDFSSPTSRGKKSVKCKSQLLPLILCPRRLLTTKFLYGCAVNACILKVNWLFDSVEEGFILPPKEYMVLKHASESCMVIGKPVSRTYFIFDNIAVMLHGKPNFCSKMAKVIKHGGGMVFKTFHWLVKSVDSKKVSVGAIVLEDENGISRQLKQCALEQKIPIMPLSWIINSLYAGKLLPSSELKLPDLPTNVELSEEI